MSRRLTPFPILMTDPQADMPEMKMDQDMPGMDMSQEEETDMEMEGDHDN